MYRHRRFYCTAGQLWGALTLALLTGCGSAPDIGGGGGGLRGQGSFNSGLSGGFGGPGGGGGERSPSAVRSRGVYPRIETSFELAEVRGNPFDFTENDVLVSFGRPDGRNVRVPAFFDGEKTWRVRYTPDQPGRYTVQSVTLNGAQIQPDKLEKREFEVSGTPLPGFIRRDTRDKTRFVFDNGNSYYPIGMNVAWKSGENMDIPDYFEKMAKAGMNWSRVWMNHWDNKNLDWVMNQKMPPGTLSLEVAKRWDAIVEAAEKNGIYFQMTLQHHGQYSSRVNSNWDENPWNKKNGGWLTTADEFFSNPRAIALTRARYRYIIARWGYSPNIMAWELFNEVEHTDAIHRKNVSEVVAWHRAMADFLRQQDPYRRLITTSSDLQIVGIWEGMDFYQPHAYPNDPVPATQFAARKLNAPLFLGEIGPGDGLDTEDGRFLRRALWSSLVSETGGAAQYWAWDVVDRKDLYRLFSPASEFVKQSGLLSRRNLIALTAGVETNARGPLSFAPAGGWTRAKQTEFTVPPSGEIPGISELPAYLQGNAHREMFPSATFNVNYPEPGTFAVTVGTVAKSGAKLVIRVDGAVAAEKEFAAAEKDTPANAVLEVKVPAGAHTVKLENAGADWLILKRITLTPYAPTLAAIGKGDKSYAVLWVYNRSGWDAPEPSGEGVSGRLTLPGMQAGAYRVTWWDTLEGKVLSEETVPVSGSGPLQITTPAVRQDVAIFLARSNEKTAAKPNALKK